MGHLAIRPGEQQCPTNTTSFTDYPITVNTTKERKANIDQVRTQINAEFTRREKATVSFTDPTITAEGTVVRKVHIDELRSNIDLIQAAPSGYPAHSCPTNSDTYCPANVLGYCASDTVSYSWTNPTIAAGATVVRELHMTEIMDNLNDEQSTCVCEMEQCNFCPDCGYSYGACSYSPCWYPACYCDDHAGCSFVPSCSPNSPYQAWACATCDEYTADYETAYALNYGACSGDTNYYTDVPWNCMCNFTPPGVDWNGTYHTYNRSAWGCKCTPFTNTGHTNEP